MRFILRMTLRFTNIHVLNTCGSCRVYLWFSHLHLCKVPVHRVVCPFSLDPPGTPDCRPADTLPEGCPGMGPLATGCMCAWFGWTVLFPPQGACSTLPLTRGYWCACVLSPWPPGRVVHSLGWFSGGGDMSTRLSFRWSWNQVTGQERDARE